MQPARKRHQPDWTSGPAGWAPILLLGVLATIGSLGAIASPRINLGSGVSQPPVADFRINVNSASEAQLQLLPRIGPKMAQRIIEERHANGPFEDAKDFQRVHGIGPKIARRIALVADFSIER